MKKLLKFTLNSFVGIVFILSSCKEEPIEEIKPGRIEFDIQPKTLTSGRTANDSLVSLISSIIITLEDGSGNPVIEMSELNVFKFGDSFISEPLSIDPGEYFLTKFFVADDSGNILFAAPVENSEFAPFVTTPLPIGILVENDLSETVDIEVVSVVESSASAFGYPSFNINVVNTFDLMISLFEYDNLADALVLTTGNLKISVDGDTIVNKNLGDSTNLVRIKDGFNNYNIFVEKDGFNNYLQIINGSDLKSLHSIDSNGSPLKVVLTEGSSNELILQPGPEAGKDALISSYEPDVNRENGKVLQVGAWTVSGSPVIYRSLLEFDLSQVPENATIQTANLFLFFAPDVWNTHSTASGSNAAWIKRITDSWDEQTITWNNQPVTTETNKVEIPESISDTQDYEIVVTTLINDMINDPSNSYGFLLMLQTEVEFRFLMFGSSDADDPHIHPKLVIQYN